MLKVVALTSHALVLAAELHDLANEHLALVPIESIMNLINILKITKNQRVPQLAILDAECFVVGFQSVEAVLRLLPLTIEVGDKTAADRHHSRRHNGTLHNSLS